MNFQEYDRKLGKTIQELKSNYHGEMMVKMGMTALTLIKKRVQETGVNAKGQKYPAYSTKDTLVGCKTFVQKNACSVLLGSKEKRKELEWRTVGGHHLAILKGGYKKIRELQGRQTNHVDFSVTNDMWNDINIISKQDAHQRGVVEIGAKEDKEKKKLAGNTKRKGDILDLNAKEIHDLQVQFNLNALQVFRNNGL
jgi:hypothetical protein